MSFILDALKKTEREREGGTIPSVNSQHSGDPPQRPGKPVWLYLIIVVLLLNAGVLLWWLKPWRGEQEGLQSAVKAEADKKQLPAQTAVAVANSGPENSVEPSNPTSSSVPPAVLRTVIAPGAVTKKHGQETKVTVPVTEPAEKSVETLRAAAGREKVAGQPQLPVKIEDMVDSSASEQTRQAVPGESAGSLPSVAGVAGEEEEAVVPVYDENSLAISPEKIDQAVEAVVEHELDRRKGNGSVPDGNKPDVGRVVPEKTAVDEKVGGAGKKGLLDYRQLSPSLQQQLPELAISLHLYSEKPERRKVSVDGRVMREKDRIGKDLILEEITPDGVIFNFAGKRFHKKVFR